MAEENNSNNSVWSNLISGAGDILNKGVDVALDVIGNKYGVTEAENSTAPASGTTSTTTETNNGLSPLAIGGIVVGSVAVGGLLIYLLTRK